VRREGPSVPRNQRVPRARVSGPSLGVRVWTIVFSQTHRVQARFATLGQKLSARFDGKAASARTIVGWLAVLVFALSMGHFVRKHLTSSPAFALNALNVKSLNRISREDLLAVADLELGQNIFDRSPAEIHAALLSHPWIVQAEVNRTLPSGFELTIHEREPVAIMAVAACGPPSTRGGDDEPGCDEPSAMYLVSADGKLFRQTSHKGSIDLPVITGLTLARYTKDPELSGRLVAEALGLLAEYRSSGLWERSPVGEIHIEVDEELSLFVGDDLTSMTYVRLGVPPYAQKLRRMKKVFERLERERARAEYIYLDNKQHPDRVAVRVR
jgi:cell division protein FtsQ